MGESRSALLSGQDLASDVSVGGAEPYETTRRAMRQPLLVDLRPAVLSVMAAGKSGRGRGRPSRPTPVIAL